MHETIKSRLSKIRALAFSGVEGERESASTLYSQLLQKYGLTDAEIISEERSLYWFKVDTEIEGCLLAQIIFMLSPEFDGTRYSSRRKRKQRGYKITALEAADVRECYAHYKADFRLQMDAFYTAYISKNRIFGASKDDEHKELSPEVKEKLARALGMLGGIEKNRWSKKAGLLVDGRKSSEVA